MELSHINEEYLVKELYHRFRCKNIKTPSRFVLIGPPGSGKGTQAPNLVKKFCLCHIATGDLFRQETAKKSKTGLLAQEYIAQGKYDLLEDILTNLLKEKFDKPECKNGALFDGFPRTVEQAKKFEEILKEEKKSLTKVIHLAVSDASVIERVSGRRIHVASGRSYHIKYNPPKVAGVDDITGEPLIQRAEDNEEKMKDRLIWYHEKTEPLLDHYKKHGLYVKVNAEQTISDVWKEIKSKIL